MAINRSLLRRISVPALALVFGTALVTAVAPPAFADNCTLTITKNSSGNYQVFVSCGRDTPQGFSLWGQDEVFDELRGQYTGQVTTVTRDVLNEDDSIFNREDDIYAKVGGVDFFGQQFNGRMTNVIHREF
ncbi:hypothetical protein [Nonomuraea sp. NPDC049158]|uniref:hypothetical protein n=1 Tax=Nonomuraea sp. NPDC049158 TaxID=3155649 RepID=UPI0033C134E3